jgi:hypothetical protein
MHFFNGSAGRPVCLPLGRSDGNVQIAATNLTYSVQSDEKIQSQIEADHVVSLGMAAPLYDNFGAGIIKLSDRLKSHYAGLETD